MIKFLVGLNRRIVSAEDRLKPPKDDVDDAKRHEMEQLYGKDAGTILELECAVQVQFEKIFDQFNPPLWPNMPLKM